MRSGLRLDRWECPVCKGGREDAYCYACSRTCVTDDVKGWEDEAVRLPRPPAVMKSPCADCAFRPESPEDDFGDLERIKTRERVFHCHHGMRILSDSYTPVADLEGVPVGYMVCAGWWAWVTGEPLPEGAYRQSPAEKRAERQEGP